jgi:selenide,water dikinase
MRGECRAEWFDSLIDSMRKPNSQAADVFARAGVTACTDITGFGLAGHLLEMLDASKVSAKLYRKNIRIYEGFDEVVTQGILSSLHKDNAKVDCRVDGTPPLPAWLFDPQTSGGLLGAVKAEEVDEVLRSLHEHGMKAATFIGEVIAPESDQTSLIYLQ